VGEPVGAPRPVGTTDLLKLAGLAFVLVDHTGLFFLTDQPWWRVVGRLAAPIFFFLIGFAQSGSRTREVPWTWLALGLLLTATDVLTSDGAEDASLNILLNFALLRTALPHIEAHVIGSPGRAVLLAALFAAAIPVIDPYLEYGAEGWLWALFGLAQRRWTEGETGASLIRALVGLVTVGAYIAREIHDYSFVGAQALALAALVAGLAVALALFRRADLPRQPPRLLAGGLRFVGRRSLEIYGVSLFLMQVTAFGLERLVGEEEETDEEEE
jgi:uncharacterized membrane protein